MQGRSMITGVIEGTSAQQAGLLAGDVIVLADVSAGTVIPWQGRQGDCAGAASCRRVDANIGYPGRY